MFNYLRENLARAHVFHDKIQLFTWGKIMCKKGSVAYHLQIL